MMNPIWLYSEQYPAGKLFNELSSADVKKMLDGSEWFDHPSDVPDGIVEKRGPGRPRKTSE